MENQKSLSRRDLVSCAIFLPIYIVFILILPKSGIVSGAASLWLHVIVYSALAVVGVIFFKDLFASGLKHWREKPMRCVFWVAGGFIAEIILETIFSIPLGILAPGYTSLNENSVFAAAQILSPVLVILVFGVLGPITEEHVFRVILTHFGNRALQPRRVRAGAVDGAAPDATVAVKPAVLPAFIAIVGSSLAFMAIHIHALTLNEFLYNLPLFGVALVSAFIMHKTKDPTIPIILHLLTNVPALIGTLL